MNIYRCICCGNTKSSEKDCTCSECGYKMYPTPYERKNILVEEIQNFIKSLMINQIDDCFSYYRKKQKRKAKKDDSEIFDIILKSEDDSRFPCFDKIQHFVCSADRTEKFIERLNDSLDQIEKYISSAYQQKYEIDFTGLIEIVEESDETITKALNVFGENFEAEKIEIPEAVLDYSEIPDEELLMKAKELLDLLHELASKIHKFIKLNNIYGTAYSKKFIVKNVTEEHIDYVNVLTSAVNKTQKILDKKYLVDIFSDGTDELYEMLRVLWNSIGLIMNAPILEKTYIYTFNEENLSEKDFKDKLIDYVNKRYAVIYNTVLATDFFDAKTEDELFNLYNKMIECDTNGYFGVNKSSLLIPGKNEAKLQKLIGLSSIKESVRKIKAYALNNKDSEALNLHMCFYGNPGTGKTEVARIIAGILYENKILPSDRVVEVDRSGLVSQYFGATAEKTKNVIESALGGVLFIDEAYALGNNSDNSITDYGREAIDTLVKAMEDYRGKFCVIFAGYKNQMLDMISINPGLRSRIQFELEFPNYSRAELKEIGELMLEKRRYFISETAMQKILDITDIRRREPNFANAREVRNLLDGIIMCQNLRCVGTEDNELGIIDVNKYIEDSGIKLPTETGSSKILTPEEELDNLIGLDSVKRMVKKIKAYAKKNKNEADFNLHMCFFGNPGTGKTEVARIISGILYNAGILSEAKLIETDSHGLIGKFVGETAPKTQSKISDAMGGVLFIDEAYGLVNSVSSSGNNYGDEAVEVLLKNMEDHRGHFCAILAGYKDEMKDLLNSNPGLQSRIQFTLEFPDYSRDELGQIALSFLKKKRYDISSDALSLLLDITEYYRGCENFANARTVRNILDQVIMNQNLRTEDTEEDNTIILCDVEDYLSDEGIDITRTPCSTLRIGFI